MFEFVHVSLAIVRVVRNEKIYAMKTVSLSQSIESIAIVLN